MGISVDFTWQDILIGSARERVCRSQRFLMVCALMWREIYFNFNLLAKLLFGGDCSAVKESGKALPMTVFHPDPSCSYLAWLPLPCRVLPWL